MNKEIVNNKASTKSWKEEYLRILLSGPSGKDDWPLAKELIDKKVVDGKYQMDMTKPGNHIYSLIWSGVNSRGREYTDELQRQLEKEAFLNHSNGNENSCDASNDDWYKKPIGIVGLAVAAAILAALAIYLIRFHFGIPV